MTEQEVREIVVTGDCYRITIGGVMNQYYVRKFGRMGMDVSYFEGTKHIEDGFISYFSIEKIERY